MQYLALTNVNEQRRQSLEIGIDGGHQGVAAGYVPPLLPFPPILAGGLHKQIDEVRGQEIVFGV
jgi:hypothetical protein